MPLVETALLLASLRRITRPPGVPPLPRIRSLAYFQPVVEELQENPVPDGYLQYLRFKLRSSLQRMGVETQRVVNVGGFTEGQRRFLDFHRDKVLLRAVR